jgi:hypothetical protein
MAWRLVVHVFKTADAYLVDFANAADGAAQRTRLARSRSLPAITAGRRPRLLGREVARGVSC